MYEKRYNLIIRSIEGLFWDSKDDDKLIAGMIIISHIHLRSSNKTHDEKNLNELWLAKITLILFMKRWYSLIDTNRNAYSKEDIHENLWVLIKTHNF